MSDNHKLAAARVYARRRAWPAEPERRLGSCLVVLPTGKTRKFLGDVWRCSDGSLRVVVQFQQMLNSKHMGWQVPQHGTYPFTGTAQPRGNTWEQQNVAFQALRSPLASVDSGFGQVAVNWPVGLDRNANVVLPGCPCVSQVVFLAAVEQLAVSGFVSSRSVFKVSKRELISALTVA